MDAEHLPALAQPTRTLPPIQAASSETSDVAALGSASAGAGRGAGAGSSSSGPDASPAPWQYPTLGQGSGAGQRAGRVGSSATNGDARGVGAAVETAHSPGGASPSARTAGSDGGSEHTGDNSADEGDDVVGADPGTPVHSPLPAALLKRFSSQCLRSSVWPSALDLTPIGGYSRLGQGKRVTDGVIRTGTLRVHCCAWNLHAKEPPEDLSAMLPPGQFHIYAIGSSECVHSIAASVIMRDKSKWETAIRKAIGPGYTKLRSHVLQAIHLIIFAHDDILPLVSDVQSAAVPCGVANTLGNKGGVGVAFQVGATSLLFVSCHLAAHQRRIQQRNGDFERIATNLPLRAPLQRASVPREPDDARREGAVIDLFDRVVFLGDMNYRINGTRAMIDSLISSRMHEVLLFNDQLRIEMKRGRVFQGFEEGPLHFAPTYKFDANSDAYDSSKKRRIPAWTDRILFKAPKGSMRLQAYDSVPSIRSSDHRPVVALFEVDVDTAGLERDAHDSATAPSPPKPTSTGGDNAADAHGHGRGEGVEAPPAHARASEHGHRSRVDDTDQGDRSTAQAPQQSPKPSSAAAPLATPSSAKLGESHSQVCALQ